MVGGATQRFRGAQTADARRPVLLGNALYANSLPTLDQLVAKKGSYEAVVKGTARTRIAVKVINRYGDEVMKVFSMRR